MPEPQWGWSFETSAGKDHQPGANDSLIYHSLFGRVMGNTVRMRPRDADGIGIGDDISPQRSKAQQQAAAWNDVWNNEPRSGAEAGETISQSQKISIKVDVFLCLQGLQLACAASTSQQ